MKIHSLILVPLLAIVSCQNEETSAETVHPASASPELIAVFKDVGNGEVVSIHELRKTAKPGDVLLLKGQVMGSVSPFVAGRAAFILGDEDLLTACSEKGDQDSCKTPWDACCDSKEDKANGTATIQVMGANGRVLKEGIEGVEGLENLSRVVIEGVVAKGSGPENLLINATAISIQ